MDEILFVQRFNYANIVVYSDSCDMQDKHLYREQSKRNVFDIDFLSEQQKSNIQLFKIPNEDDSRTKNITVYKTKKGESQDHFFKKIKEYSTIDDSEIKENYVNPMTHIVVHTIERVIKKKDDKIIVKFYKQTKERRFNSKFFKKYSNNEILSFNLKTGDITVGEISRNGRTKNTRFRKNSFLSLRHFISSSKIFHLTSSRGCFVDSKSDVFPSYIIEMSDSTFINRLLAEIGSDLAGRGFSLSDNNDRELFFKSILNYFIEKKKIKVPNEYTKLLVDYYPTEMYLKKNDRKLVVSILDSFGINSKSMVRLLHDHPNIDLGSLATLCSFFGDEYSKYLSSIPTDIIVTLSMDTSHSSTSLKSRKRKLYDLNNHEKECLVSVIMDKEMRQGRVSSLLSLITDHMSMIYRIREYIPETRLNARTYSAFHTEHMELSKMIASISKGWSIEYVYDNRVIRKIESPIVYVHGDKEYEFKPYILKRDEDYDEEGKFMHHCVASYANKESSMIISIRLNGGQDRVTCEYDKKSGRVIQERHFTNKIPPPYFSEALQIVSDRVNIFHRQRLLNHLTTKKVRVKINGIEVPVRNVEDELFGMFDNMRPRLRNPF